MSRSPGALLSLATLVLVLGCGGGSGSTVPVADIAPAPLPAPAPAPTPTPTGQLTRAQQPFGIYAIDRLVDRPFVDGVLVRPRWSEMEPEEGRYDFTKIDAAIRNAAAAGKSVTLASLVNFAPDWLRAKSQRFQSRGEELIVPWDETMLLALEKLVQAQAAHRVDGVALRDHATLRQVNATIGGITSIRLVDLPPGYSAARLKGAIDRSVAAWATAYPSGKHLYVGLFAVNDGARAPTTAESLRDSLLATYDGRSAPRLHFFQELLTGIAPRFPGELAQVLQGVAGRSGVMFQACGPWSAQHDPAWPCNWATPVDTPELGMGRALQEFGSVYFEIYNVDLESETYRAQFESFRRRIDERP